MEAILEKSLKRFAMLPKNPVCKKIFMRFPALPKRCIGEGRRYASCPPKSLLFSRVRSGYCETDGGDPSWLVNLTNKPITLKEQQLLSKGLDFSVAPKILPVEKIISVLEGVCKDRRKTQADILRTEVCKLIQNFAPARNLSDQNLQTLFFLRKDAERVFLKSEIDSLVVMKRKNYIAKMTALVEDKDRFEQVRKDPTEKIRTEVRKMLRKLKDEKLIDRECSPLSECVVPGLYGLPKIHKGVVTLQLSYDASESPVIQLSELLCKMLASVTNQFPRSISPSCFVREVLLVKVDSNDLMHTFHVDSLFTNVSTDDVIRETYKNLQEKIPPRKFPLETLLDLLHVCLDNAYVSFNGKFFKQISGIPPESSLTPLIVGLYMDKIDRLMLGNSNVSPKVWLRRDGDIFSIVKRDQMEFCWKLVENAVPSFLALRVETEESDRLPFGSVLVTRCGSSLETQVYRRSIHSDRCLNFHSNSPLSTKMAVIRSLYERAFSHCSDTDKLREELRYVGNALVRNNYPPSLIRKVQVEVSGNGFLKFNLRNKRSVENSGQIPVKRKLSASGISGRKPLQYTSRDGNDLGSPGAPGNSAALTISLPYIRNFSEAVERLLQTFKIGVSFRPYNVLEEMLRYSESLDSGMSVYRIRCKNCDSVYIGETGRNLSVRIKEHRRAVENNGSGLSAIARHSTSLGHSINFENIQVLDSKCKKEYRKVIEACYISQEKKVMNRNKGRGFSKIWKTVL